MKTISSKLNMYVTGVSVVNNNIEKLLFNIILCFFGVLALLYFLFLGNMVKNIIERKSFEANASTLSNQVRDLELTYLSMSNNIDLPLSYSMGFQETKTVFATRKALGYKPADEVLNGASFNNVKTVQNDI